jgi:hypothetical protein
MVIKSNAVLGPCSGHNTIQKSFLLLILLSLSLASNLVIAQTDSTVELFAPARQGGLWGYINQKGDWVIQPEYGYAKSFHENLAEVVLYRGDTIINCFINKSNKIIFELPELNYSIVSEGMLAYLEKGVYGFMDSTGNKVIPAQFLYCSNFQNGKAMVTFKSGKAGYINKKKQLILSPRWDTTFNFQGKFAVVGKRDAQRRFKYGIIDQYANTLVPIQYTIITPLSEDKAFANLGGTYENQTIKGGKWYIVNMAKQSMLALCDTTVNAVIGNYGYLLRYKNGLTWFPGQYKGQILYGLMNETGDWVVLPKYKLVSNFFEDMASVSLGGRLGFIDSKGRNIIPCIYQSVGAFHNGLTWFKEGKKYGFLNKEGEVVIPPIFDEVGDFAEVK